MTSHVILVVGLVALVLAGIIWIESMGRHSRATKRAERQRRRAQERRQRQDQSGAKAQPPRPRERKRNRRR